MRKHCPVQRFVRTRLPALLLLALLFAVWFFATANGRIAGILLPAPAAVWAGMVELFDDGVLLKHVRVSVLRLLLGFALSAVMATAIAFVFAHCTRLRRACEPLLEFVRQIPPLAMMPLLILWLGIGEAQKIGIITLACFFPVYLATLGGIAQCDARLLEVGRVSGLSPRAILRRIVLPSAMPSVVVGLRIALGQGWRALVGAELIASSAGLGYMIDDAQNLARTDIVVVGIFVIGALGLASDWLARRAIAAYWPWIKTDTATATTDSQARGAYA